MWKRVRIALVLSLIGIATTAIANKRLGTDDLKGTDQVPPPRLE
jgi:hypothetical protein